MSDRFLKLAQVCELTAMSRASIYRMMDSGQFPHQIKIMSSGKTGSVVWSERDVLAWMEKVRGHATERTIASCLKLVGRGSKSKRRWWIGPRLFDFVVLDGRP